MSRAQTAGIVTPGKVNMFLKVTKRRADGYHELETLFFPVFQVGDELSVQFNAAPGICLACNYRDVPTDERNIVCKAAKLYSLAAKIPPSWSFNLTKQIPAAAGMGGGSSDAAACLQLLNKYYHKLDELQLHHLASQLGADVPFFLNPVPSVATGIGEKLVPLPPEYHIQLPIVLVNPRFPVSAAWAYKHLRPERIGELPGRLDILLAAIKEQNWATAAEYMYNDLEFALLEKFPLLQILADFMWNSTGMRPMITGSGSTIFTLCDSPATADKLRSTLQANFPTCRII